MYVTIMQWDNVIQPHSVWNTPPYPRYQEVKVKCSVATTHMVKTTHISGLHPHPSLFPRELELVLHLLLHSLTISINPPKRQGSNTHVDCGWKLHTLDVFVQMLSYWDMHNYMHTMQASEPSRRECFDALNNGIWSETKQQRKGAAYNSLDWGAWDAWSNVPQFTVR